MGRYITYLLLPRFVEQYIMGCVIYKDVKTIYAGQVVVVLRRNFRMITYKKF